MFYPKLLLLMFFLINENVLSQKLVSSNRLNCTLNHHGRLLKDGESVDIKGKFYKMEDCALQRAYHACGSHLLQMVSIACGYIQKPQTIKQRFKRFLPRKLLTEACCETLCTVNEMTRYCPQN